MNKDDLINELKERAKELNCLYETQELLNDKNKLPENILQGIINVIPSGWQFPNICIARIHCNGITVQSENFKVTKWVQSTEIKMQDDEIIGKIEVFYIEERPEAFKGPFLKDEQRLIKTIAEQIGSYFFHRKLKSVFDARKEEDGKKISEWEVIIDMLKKTNPKLLIRISRKMVNYMRWKGIAEAENLFNFFNPVNVEEGGLNKETNFPFQAKDEFASQEIISKIFGTASKHVDKQEIMDNVSRWIKQDQSGFLVEILGNSALSVGQMSNILERYHHLKKQGLELTPIRRRNVVVSLTRRLLTDHSDFLKLGKRFLDLECFNELISKTIYPVDSYGKIGGKSTGLFLASNILKKSDLSDELAKNVKTPKTWYITTDGLLTFMKHNSLEEIAEQKYKNLSQVRSEYPYVAYVFKNSSFTQAVLNGLSSMLDDFGLVPLVIRSTSLLEDQQNAVFAGKYKSLFISNQGTKEERLAELTNAIAEVYASTFGPDPIEYRIEHDLLDENEEMGIMIQEVVGQRVGDYYLPAFAGVAFSKNNFRWSSRIELDDGLIRLVPGLGTRAVDRLSNDYPILISPGKPNLRVNVTLDEIIRYSPKYVDVINLEKRKFETIGIDEFIREHGKEYPEISKIVSKISDNFIQQPSKLRMNFEQDNYVVTFNGLVENTEFINQIKSILNVLETEFGYPIDVEFAHDGKDFYLLQSRPQSYSKVNKPAEIPASFNTEELLFSATKYISDGTISNITNIVYVDPDKYSEVSDYEELVAIGEAVGRLNKLLPKRQFILIGPGRWGSRGDIKLGVRVTYSDINNTSVLIEVAKKKKDYIPELSFGTHFFQDLVEANILYLPLYPDDIENVFNDNFFSSSKNVLVDLLPDLKNLTDVLKVIDVSAEKKGKVVEILMNAEESKAVAVLSDKKDVEDAKFFSKKLNKVQGSTDYHWRWRLEVVEKIASKIDAKKLGVKGFYVFGSTKNATAGPSSDIDILVHFEGDENQRNCLVSWLDAWSISLDYINFQRTGHKTGGLLDVHIITDDDIKKKNSFAIKIGAITDPAKPLKIGTDL
ncbi:MAG: nucleotidyltransferase domain-containing protein [Bacteroidales bacterium]|nr:nucleotidyltransferase domain-containing protein [Bacteroidales bacterium]